MPDEEVVVKLLVTFDRDSKGKNFVVYEEHHSDPSNLPKAILYLPKHYARRLVTAVLDVEIRAAE